MNEKSIQEAIFEELWDRGQRLIFPNAFLYHGEADLLAITNANFAYEYEIKCSRADYKQDFKTKRPKHEALKERKHGAEPTHWGRRYIDIPNYFYFVCPEKMVSIEEIPEYAGLIYIKEEVVSRYYDWKETNRIEWIKNAPRLHRDKFRETAKVRLEKSFFYKYWNLRLRKVNGNG